MDTSSLLHGKKLQTQIWYTENTPAASQLAFQTSTYWISSWYIEGFYIRVLLSTSKKCSK